MKKLHFDTYRYQLPAILWAIFILVVCTLPIGDLHSGGFFGKLPVDKMVHLFLFFVLVYLVMRGVRKKSGAVLISFRTKLAIMLLAVAYGILIELVQHYFTVKRTGDVWDIAADGLGAGCCFLYLRFISAKKWAS